MIIKLAVECRNCKRQYDHRVCLNGTLSSLVKWASNAYCTNSLCNIKNVLEIRFIKSKRQR